MLDSSTITTTADKVKGFLNDFDLKKWSEEIGGTYSEALQAGIYFSISFAAGFIIKRYFKFIFCCMIATILIIKGMEYYKLLEIDWVAVRDLIGISADKKDFFTPIINNMVAWVKANLISAIAGLVGLLIGYKLG